MKHSIRTAALCAALALALAVPASAAETGYADVAENAWYSEAVLFCREAGLMSGASSRQFSPNRTVTRGMLAVILHRMAGPPQVNAQTAFPDVAEDAWYAPAVRWASAAGAMGGYRENRFAPEEPVTRQQLAAVLWRRSGSPVRQAEDFADEASIASYAAQAVDWARSTGLMSGGRDGRFNPAQPLTRAQLAQVLLNRSRLAGTVSQLSAMDIMCQPCGLSAMDDGTLLVTDEYNKVVWRVSEGRRSLLYAGSGTDEDVYGQPMGGYHDDTLLKSIFKDPWAVVPFLDSWAVSDPENQVVRFLRTGEDGMGMRTEVTDLGIAFDHPTGMAVDGDGNLYVS